MVNNYKSVWEQCLKIIRGNVTVQQYETWFAPIVFESFSTEKNTLLVQVPSSFVYEYLEQHFVGLLSKVLAHCFGTNVRLTYRIVTDKSLGTQMMATGEVMSIGNSFEAAMMKAVSSIELGMDTLTHKPEHIYFTTVGASKYYISVLPPSPCCWINWLTTSALTTSRQPP